MMKRMMILAAMAAAATGGWGANHAAPPTLKGLCGTSASVDFGRPAGEVRRLNGMCNGVKLYGMGSNGMLGQVNDWMKELELPYVRFHDVALENPGMALVDVSRIFPLFHADADDPRNYDFGPTDEYLCNCLKLGAEIEFKFGETIEHSPTKYRVRVPEDPEKWADICLHIVRHYNAGWANGFRYGIRRWSVWEEPNNCRLLQGEEAFPKRFVAMYAVLAKRLKAEFPDCLVGGPAMMDDTKCSRAFLEGCRAAGAPVDFHSFTTYRREVKTAIARIAEIRRLTDDCGFAKAELHLSEWHRAPVSWSSTLEKASAYRRDLTDAASAAYAAGLLSAAQDAPVDRMFFYSMSLGSWGLLEPNLDRRPVWYVFKAFAEVARTKNRVETTSDAANGWYALGAKAGDGKGVLLVSNVAPKGPARIAVAGGLRPMEVLVVADGRNLEPEKSWTFADGVLTIESPRGGGVTWLVRFDSIGDEIH